jgi:hypothetical protein
MGEATETVQIVFAIPNNACKYYREGFDCVRDDKLHTCCKEECKLPGILLDMIEQHVATHHEFENGVCIHCGDTEPIKQ